MTLYEFLTEFSGVSEVQQLEMVDKLTSKQLKNRYEFVCDQYGGAPCYGDDNEANQNRIKHQAGMIKLLRQAMATRNMLSKRELAYHNLTQEELDSNVPTADSVNGIVRPAILLYCDMQCDKMMRHFASHVACDMTGVGPEDKITIKFKCCECFGPNWLVMKLKDAREMYPEAVGLNPALELPIETRRMEDDGTTTRPEA
jgi:hypothetical protein